MAGNYKVISLDPRTPTISKVDHGDFGTYDAAASVARIIRKMNPIKTVLIEIPKVVLSDKIEFAVLNNNPSNGDAYSFESAPFHW